MKACFASEMRGVDKAASEIGGIPSIVLMENAAMACVEELKNDFANLSEKSVAVFCGKGNNGGDGFAIARHLYNMGIDVAERYYDTASMMCPSRFLPLYKLFHLYKNMGNRKCMLRVAESVIDKPMKIKTSAIRMMKREMKSEQAQLLIEENNN